MHQDARPTASYRVVEHTGSEEHSCKDRTPRRCTLKHLPQYLEYDWPSSAPVLVDLLPTMHLYYAHVHRTKLRHAVQKLDLYCTVIPIRSRLHSDAYNWHITLLRTAAGVRTRRGSVAWTTPRALWGNPVLPRMEFDAVIMSNHPHLNHAQPAMPLPQP